MSIIINKNIILFPLYKLRSSNLALRNVISSVFKDVISCYILQIKKPFASHFHDYHYGFYEIGFNGTEIGIGANDFMSVGTSVLIILSETIKFKVWLKIY